MTDSLKRRIGPGLLTVYGIGIMVGAGIYVLIGAVAGAAGIWAPLAFLLAALVALPSALSFAELSTRMPEAAGEVAFVEAGFQSRWLGILIGLAIVASGAISAGAVLRGGVGYFSTLVPIDTTIAIIVGGTILTVIALIGVLESLAFAAALTVIEVAGLLLVAWAGFQAPATPDWLTAAAPEWSGIAAAVALCFFAFIGFEDLNNMAEEVHDPSRVMPRGILWALTITAALYGLVSLAAVHAVPLSELAVSEQPLALVWEQARGTDPAFLSAIAVLAATNGVLAQIVMAARVLFGLSRRARWLAAFGHTQPRFGTPVLATILTGVAVIAAAVALPVAVLAELTAYVLFTVFMMVNLALILLKRRLPEAPFRVPSYVPVAGLILAATAMAASLWGATA